ncbi:MAG: YbfB/YjiJ family MFS transporter, partial [Candidatus Eremiobacteraeota bacterium]|nr:YbfB/YjiJ family MFS transporter [Candidatus Eremiobacteraeota bacterium]
MLAVAMGFGRFAYTPLLVVMQRDAGLTVAFAGVLASINLSGYLCGALVAMHGAVRSRRHRVLNAAAIAVVISTAMMALPPQWWAVARFSTGVASGVVFVLVVSLLLDRSSRTASIGGIAWLFSGVGSGIAAAGVFVPVIASIGGSRVTWLATAFVCLVALLVALPHLGDEPLAPVQLPVRSESPKSSAFSWLS